MIVACNGIARPIRNIELIPLSTHPVPRTMAKDATKERSTAGTMAPTVTMTLLRKKRGKPDSMTSA